MSQSAAAEAVGKSRQTIVNWESETATPEPDERELGVLAALYGVSARVLRYEEVTRARYRPVTDSEETARFPRVMERSAHLPRQIEAMALRFEAECIENGATEGDMAFIRRALHSPETVHLFEEGYQDKPLNAEEQVAEMENLLDELRDWLEGRKKLRSGRRR